MMKNARRPPFTTVGVGRFSFLSVGMLSAFIPKTITTSEREECQYYHYCLNSESYVESQGLSRFQQVEAEIKGHEKCVDNKKGRDHYVTL